MRCKMKKLTILALIFAIFSAFFVFDVNAEQAAVPPISDSGNLLTSSEEKAVSEKLLTLENKHNIEVFIVLLDGRFSDCSDTDELTRAMRRYAENYYGNSAVNEDGVLMLISLDGGYKDYYFYTHGRCHDLINDSEGMDYIEDNVMPLIRDREFYGACLKYLEVTDYALSNPEEISEYGHMGITGKLGIALLVSFGIGLIAVLVMKSGMKSVRPKRDASDYSLRNTFNLTRCADIFLYRTVSKTPIPKNNSSSGRSGGRSGGGGRGGSC